MPEGRVIRRLAAILAADVAGYSRLMGADEEGTLAALKAIRRELSDPKVKGHRGRIVKTTGDGLLIEFASVVDAVRCAVEVQEGMAERNARVPEARRIEFRMGINLGDIIRDRGDIYGDGVNVAARLEALAEPGGICVSRVVCDQVRDKLDFSFEDMGEQRVKNITRPVHVWRIRPGAEPTTPAPALALPDKPSIAVLPFQNMSGDPEQDYFADGMVEEIITALSKMRWFFVIARNSTFTYKGKSVDIKQVGRDLGVRYALEGSVRKAGNRMRITAQLIDAATGNHVWAERYDRGLADMFAVQDEITERVVAAIEPELYAAEDIHSRRKPPESLDAWECVMRALSAIGQGTREGNTEAERLCRRAIAIAPAYGQAHSLLSWALIRHSYWSGDLRTVAAEIDAEAQLALAIDDRDPWAHLAQGNAFIRFRRFEEAVMALRRALELNPNFALAHAVLATALAEQETGEGAAEHAEHALRLSPNDRSVGMFAALAMFGVQFRARCYADSIIWARKIIEKSPQHLAGHVRLTAALAMQGERAAVSTARDALLRIQPKFSIAWMTENMVPSRELADLLCDGLRKAGLPER
jgi:adenylate cyclase